MPLSRPYESKVRDQAMTANSLTKTTIPIGTAGTVEVALPVIEIGEGNPRVLILVGLHGDEYTGFYVVERLLERLRLSRGSVKIISAANPLAQALRLREEPLAKLDINRIFPGDREKDFSRRIAAVLFEQAKECHDCVIDLHTLGMHSRLMCLHINHGSRETRTRSLDLIHAFGPDLVWQLDTSSGLGARWRGSMGPEMAQQKIVNFVVELAEHYHVDDEELNRAASGILRVLGHLQMIDDPPAATTSPPQRFAYQDVTADSSGLFEPDWDLLAAIRSGRFPHVQVGQRIGSAIDPASFERTDVLSKFDGPLIALSGRWFLRTGDAIYNVGETKAGQLISDTTLAIIDGLAKALAPHRNPAQQADIVRLADEVGADRSICRAALALSFIETPGESSTNTAVGVLKAFSDIDEDTRDWILECIKGSGVVSPEAQVVTQLKPRSLADDTTSN